MKGSVVYGVEELYFDNNCPDKSPPSRYIPQSYKGYSGWAKRAKNLQGAHVMKGMSKHHIAFLSVHAAEGSESQPGVLLSPHINCLADPAYKTQIRRDSCLCTGDVLEEAAAFVEDETGATAASRASGGVVG
ncbi:hypothetical protein DV515_00000626 [Chloebia gouldiae]|uniref:Uncharacterized protein n=1 Tax=Chloebia gouldiae TaxID=44316 RepID=A0A3L8T881_CHLGU|nr:hypothetical protein DV515_00000626 [Chloebia gouldiae]